jgi:hypothetical protein
VKRRDYRAEYRRRQELARERGFRNYSKQREAPRRIRNSADLARLSEAARGSRKSALRVLRISREEGVPIEKVARREGVSADTVRWWAADALQPTRGGRTMPTRGDRLLRMRPIILEDAGGADLIEVRGSAATVRAQEAFDLQWGFINGTVDAVELQRLRGVRVAGRPVEADPERLREIAAAGGVDVPDAYRAVLG